MNDPFFVFKLPRYLKTERAWQSSFYPPKHLPLCLVYTFSQSWYIWIASVIQHIYEVTFMWETDVVSGYREPQFCHSPWNLGFMNLSKPGFLLNKNSTFFFVPPISWCHWWVKWGMSKIPFVRYSCYVCLCGSISFPFYLPQWLWEIILSNTVLPGIIITVSPLPRLKHGPWPSTDLPTEERNSGFLLLSLSLT